MSTLFCKCMNVDGRCKNLHFADAGTTDTVIENDLPEISFSLEAALQDYRDRYRMAVQEEAT